MRVLLELCLAVLLMVGAGANYQAWSERTRLDREHTLSCNVTSGNVSVSADKQLSWTKLGRETELETDEYYQLLNDSGVTNMLLKIRRVTLETGGFYFCTVTNSSGGYVGRAVVGLNIAGHEVEDQFEEYRGDVIRGVISAASVFAVVVGICVVDRFRYQTDEQKQKMRERKQGRLRKLQQPGNGGVDNLAMEGTGDDLNKHNGSMATAFDINNTHL